MSGAQPRDRLYLRQILDAIDRIESYLRDVGRFDFDVTPLLQDGVIRQLQIIGEAAKRLSPSLKDGPSTMPWREVTGMRDSSLTTTWASIWMQCVDDGNSGQGSVVPKVIARWRLWTGGLIVVESTLAEMRGRPL